MKIYDIGASYEYSSSTGLNQYDSGRPLLIKLKDHFLKYENISLHHEYHGDSFSRISFAVNDMENITFCIELSKNRNFELSICRASDVESENAIARFQPSLYAKIDGPYKDEDGNAWYSRYTAFKINAFEKDDKLIAFLPHATITTSADDAIVFGTDCFGEKYIYIAYANKLYYDSPDYIEHKCDADRLSVSVDGYVYLKKKICIYINGNISATTDTVGIICNTNLGTSTNNTYLNLIDIDGTKYRQLKANIWIEDKEE